MSEAFVERFASVLYESDEFIESWSDASDADRHEYLAIARREVSALLDHHAHEMAEKIRNSEVLRSYTDGHMGDCLMAADLIDSEVAT